MDDVKCEIREFVAKVRQIAFDLHAYLGTGLLERVYENGMFHRLQKDCFRVERQKPLKVYDNDGFCLGDYFADLVVEGKLIVELKAVANISNEHYAQILNYLKITGAPAGLLINFGSYKFQVRTVIPHFPSYRSSTFLHGENPPSVPSTSSTLLHGENSPFVPSTSSTLLHGENSPSVPSASSTLLHGENSPSVPSASSTLLHGENSPSVPSTSSTLLHGENSPSVPSASSTLLHG